MVRKKNLLRIDYRWKEKVVVAGTEREGGSGMDGERRWQWR